MKIDTIIGHYHILRPLGAGGMGEVYHAEDTRLKREVAIKVLPERLRSDPERLKRFRREAEAAARLKHPNIATIHALEEADDMLFLVMEYVDGVSLKEAIPDGGLNIVDPNANRTGAMNRPISFFDIFIPLADAHAHSQGRIHRDIKPGNIMIAEDGTPTILDFGLARIINLDPLAVDTIPGEQSEPAQALGPDDETRTMDTEAHRKAAEAAKKLCPASLAAAN